MTLMNTKKDTIQFCGKITVDRQEFKRQAWEIYKSMFANPQAVTSFSDVHKFAWLADNAVEAAAAFHVDYEASLKTVLETYKL